MPGLFQMIENMNVVITEFSVHYLLPQSEIPLCSYKNTQEKVKAVPNPNELQ